MENDIPEKKRNEIKEMVRKCVEPDLDTLLDEIRILESQLYNKKIRAQKLAEQMAMDDLCDYRRWQWRQMFPRTMEYADKARREMKNI